MKITEEAFRAALAIVKQGGTADHPYDQKTLGSPECGSACCIVGHTYVSLGYVSLGYDRNWGWPEVDDSYSPWLKTALGVARSIGSGAIRAIEQIKPDGSLAGVDLGGVDLTDANLRNANLTDANLWNANLMNANLMNANLTGADLRGADLTNADLTDANLRGADLTNADLRNADLTDANLTNANTTNIIR